MRERRIWYRRRWLLIGLAALVAAVCGTVWAVWPRQVRVQTAVVTRKTLADKIFVSGTVRPVERQIVTTQQLPGPIHTINVQVGQVVHKGDVLLTCENAAQASALTAARTAVTQAEQALAATLQQQRAAPPGFQTQFSGTLATEETTLAQAKAQLAQAQAAYDATVVRASLDGTVVLIDASGLAADGTPGPVMEVVSADKRIVANLSEIDAVRVQPGMTAEITSDAFPNLQWTATVERIAAFAAGTDAGTGQVEVDLKPPSHFIVPYGYHVDVHIVVASHAQVPVIPYSALAQDGDSYSVFTVVDGRVHQVAVTLGITTDTEVEVTHGLSPGQVIVVNPPASLRDGQGVDVRD